MTMVEMLKQSGLRSLLGIVIVILFFVIVVFSIFGRGRSAGAKEISKDLNDVKAGEAITTASVTAAIAAAICNYRKNNQ